MLEQAWMTLYTGDAISAIMEETLVPRQPRGNYCPSRTQMRFIRKGKMLLETPAL